MNKYECATCGGSVVKKPCGEKIGKTERSGLHGWSCTAGCGKGVKVKRTTK